MDALLITKCGCTRKLRMVYSTPNLSVPFARGESMIETEHCKVPKNKRRDFKLESETNNFLVYKEV